MVKMKVIRMFLIGMLTLILLTGCWNRIEINDIAIVTAIGLDLTESDEIHLSLQVAIPSKLGSSGPTGGSSEKSTFVISETGSTISEAFSNIQGKLSRTIFFSQSRIVIIGEELAKKSVSHVIDFQTRYAEPRINSFIMFTKGKAFNIIKSMPKFESISAEEIKELAKLGVSLKIYVRDFLNMLLTDGIEPFAPQLTLKPLEVNRNNTSEKTLAINGIAIFKQDKLIGWMSEEETRGLLWLRNEMEKGIITTSVPKDKGGGNISMEITRADVKIVPILKNQDLKMDVHIISELTVIENDSQLNLFDTKVIEDIQKDINTQIKNKVQLVIDKGQKEYNSDIFGFGHLVYQRYPKEWNTKYKNNWEEEFAELEVTINSKAFIRRIGLIK